MKKLSFSFLFILIAFACNTKSKPKLEHKILGEGPSVILENGMASTFDTWKTIPDSLAKKTKVLIYNRAGLGNSEMASTKRTIPNMVSDLEALLKEKKLEVPFVLVAHSMGSYLVRYFTLKHPEKVKGILLIDPSPDTMYDAYTDEETREFLNFGNENFKNSSLAVKNEWENYLENRKYVQQAISNEIPITILSATQWDFYKYHKTILNNHPESKHLKIEGSHDLHHENPALIIKSIFELASK